MATKNLARTAIEGGRGYYNCWQRRYSHARARAGQRNLQASLRARFDLDDLVMPEPARVRPWFHDKLSAPERWLERQVGRPWRLVRGELFERFDTRTTAGRHILFCHLLPWVEGDRFRFLVPRFEVDEHGILRTTPRQRFHRQLPEPLPLPQHQVERWLAGRRVGERGTALFWFALTPGGGYRQERRLSRADVDLWRSLPAWFRQQNDALAPRPATTTATASRS